jgi:hypothetical protein
VGGDAKVVTVPSAGAPASVHDRPPHFWVRLIDRFDCPAHVTSGHIHHQSERASRWD